MYILKSLRAKYKETPWFTVPFIDKNGVAQTGQNDMSKAELSKQPYIIEKNMQYPLNHNEPLDESNPEQRVKLNMIKHLPEVAPSKSKADPVKHIFYLYNAEEEAVENIGSFEAKMKAMKVVDKNSSNTAIKDLAYFLGIDPRRHSSKVLTSMIYVEADKNPEKVASFDNDKAKSQLFIRKLVKTGIVRKTNQGYYFNEILLGFDEKEAIGFINKEDKADVKERLGQLLRKVA